MDMESTKKYLVLFLFAITFSLNAVVCAGPPLPCHTVEGNSGVFITSTAYMTNPPDGNDVFGLPSVSFSFAALREKDYESVAVTENLWGKVELGYAMERIGLGDWPEDVRNATGIHVNNHVFKHNFNARLMVIEEGSYDCAWMPAVTIGTHLKVNDGHSTINRQTNRLCDALGVDHDTGIEFTAVATKTIADWLPRPLIVSAGLRNGDAVHTGLLGFAGERRTTFEGSLIYFLADKLLIATEYRQKPNFCDTFQVGGKELIKGENDWWDICLGYIVNDHLTIAGGYANFGNVLNHREDNVWAVQFKYEF
jgi:hypothetical protein